MKISTIKKAVLSVALGAALVATVSGVTYNQKSAAAESVYNEATCFQANVKPDANQKYDSNTIELFVSRAIEEDINNINFVYNDLYSINNESYGYVLDFTYSNGYGFIIISVDGEFEQLVEMDLNHSSPYYGKNGKYIYYTFGHYFIEHNNGQIVKISENGEEVESELPRGTGPLKSKDKKTAVEKPQNYSYYTGTLYQKEISNFYYNYSTAQSTKDNNCANAAGVIYLNYWNSYHKNRLLNLYYSQSISGTYNMNENTSTQYMNKFYDYMDTNWIFGLWGGTLPSDCYKGFMRIISENGYVARKETVSSFDDIKYQINRGVPIFITSEDYYFTNYYYGGSAVPLPTVSSTPGDYKLTIEHREWKGLANSHTFVGFGYAEYTLYDKNGKESKIHFVKVADGWGDERYFNYDISDTTEWGMAAIRVSRC